MNNEEENNEPESEDSIIVLKTFNNEVDAELVAGYLRTHDIEAFISRNDPAMVGMMRSARLLVKRVDIERAIKVLDAMNA